MSEIISSKTIPNLLSVIDENVTAVIWVTEGQLDQRPVYFDQIDYLLDGMLTKHITRQIKQDRPTDDGKVLFFNETFGQKFSLAILAKNEKLKNNIEEFLNLLNKTQDRKVVIISKDSIDKSLLKKFSDISFEYFLQEKP